MFTINIHKYKWKYVFKIHMEPSRGMDLKFTYLDNYVFLYFTSRVNYIYHALVSSVNHTSEKSFIIVSDS